MQVVPLSDWYPRFGGWTGTLVPRHERVGWVIHHTVGGTGYDPEAYARGVADYHYGKWGVPGGYNYLIGEDGVIRVMCGLAFKGVHSGTHEWNRKSLGLAFQGDFRGAPPSDQMLTAAAELIADTSIPTTQWGHRDVRPKPTTCPGGELYELLPLELEEDMSPKDWDNEDWRAFINNAGWGSFPGGPDGRSAWQTLNDIKAMVGAIDLDDNVTEEELDQRVDRLIETLPNVFVDRLKQRL